MRAFKWFVLNGIFAAMLWFGFVEGVAGAKNVGLVMTWIVIVSSWGYLSDECKATVRKKGRSVSKEIGLPFDFLIVGFLAWHGAIITAAFYFLSIILSESAFSDDEA